MDEDRVEARPAEQRQQDAGEPFLPGARLEEEERAERDRDGEAEQPDGSEEAEDPAHDGGGPPHGPGFDGRRRSPPPEE